MPIIEITDPKATLDGGDILFTGIFIIIYISLFGYFIIIIFVFLGREIFVGVSQRTNISGALAVASAFPEYYVTPINIPRKVMHLKSCVSMAGSDILCVGSSPEAQEVLRVIFNEFILKIVLTHCLQRIASEASFPYTTITVHDNESANVLYINGTLGK